MVISPKLTSVAWYHASNFFALTPVSIFWHFPFKLDHLTTKMAFIFGFGTLEACKIAHEVCTFEVFWAKCKIPGESSGQPGAAG